MCMCVCVCVCVCVCGGGGGPPPSKIQFRHTTALKLGELISCIMFYKICQLGNQVIVQKAVAINPIHTELFGWCTTGGGMFSLKLDGSNFLKN